MFKLAVSNDMLAKEEEIRCQNDQDTEDVEQGLSVAWSESPALCLKMLQNQSWRCVNRQQFSSASFWLGGENRSGPEPVLQHMKTHTGLSLLAALNPCAEGSTKGTRGYLRVVSSGGMVCPLCNIQKGYFVFTLK